MIPCIFLSSCCLFNPKPPTPEEYYKAIFKLSQVRTLAQDSAKAGKAMFQNNQEVQGKIREKYDISRRKGGAFVDAIRLAITARDKEVTFQQEVKEIEDSVTELISYIEEKKKEKRESVYLESVGIGEIIAGAIEGLAKAGVIIWKAAKDEEERIVEQIKNELERQRWSIWENLE